VTECSGETVEGEMEKRLSVIGIAEAKQYVTSVFYKNGKATKEGDKEVYPYVQ
jgi:hypothetical protein